jgi:cobalt transporter subunit CbtA
MWARVLLSVILVGLAAGLLMGLIQHVRLTPLILEAETFEHMAHGHGAEAHSHGDQVWSPTDGMERTIYTTATAVIAAVGFALLLAGASFAMNIPITMANGWVWGLAGFIAMSFAPAIGLPPELPGMPAAELNSRVFWWTGCIGLTVMGLFLFHRSFSSIKALVPALAGLALPHVLFTPPKAVAEASQVPAHLAAQFVTASLGANLIMWIVIGVGLGWALKKFESVFAK